MNWELYFKHTANNLLLITTNANGNQTACGGTGCTVSYSRGSSGFWAAVGRDPPAGRCCRAPRGWGLQWRGVIVTLCAEQQLSPESLLRWGFLGDENLGFFSSCLILNRHVAKIYRWSIWRWRTLFDVASFVYNWIFINVLFVVTFLKIRLWKLEALFSVDFYLFWSCGRMRKYHGYN